MNKILQITLLTLLISCNNKNKTENTINEEIDKAESKISNEISSKEDNHVRIYTIIKEDIDRAFNKISIEIRLKEEVTEMELRNIAFELKDDRGDFDSIWIFYYLQGQELGNGAWAITHFKPELKIEILGATKKASSDMNSIKVTGEILNTWFDNDSMLPNKKYLVKENGKFFMKSVYSKSKLAGAGGEMVEEVFEKKLNNGTLRYDYDNNYDEYYLIEKNGNLGMYDYSGKFKEASRTN